MGPALLLGEDFVPWPCRQKPLRATAEHGEQKQIPKEEMNFHVDVQKMDPVTFFIYFLYYVSECIMIQIFLACSPFFMLSFLHDPSDSIFFPQISADFSVFCGGVLSNSVHRTAQGIFLCNSFSWVDFLQTCLSGSSIKKCWCLLSWVKISMAG